LKIKALSKYQLENEFKSKAKFRGQTTDSIVDILLASIYSLMLCACSGHRRCQNCDKNIRKSAKPLAIASCATFFSSPHFEVISNPFWVLTGGNELL